MSNENYGRVNPNNGPAQGADNGNESPANTNKAPEIIKTLSKIAPFLLVGGVVLALILYMTGNHVVVYEMAAGGKCGEVGCTKTQLSLPMIAALVAIADGLAFTIFGLVQKAQEQAKLNQ